MGQDVQSTAKTLSAWFLIPAALGLSSCAPQPPSGAELVAMCQGEVAPVGNYEYDDGQAIPVMKPVGSGTEEEARVFNSCIRAKARQSGMIPVSSSTGYTGAACVEGTPTISGGSTYCIGDL